MTRRRDLMCEDLFGCDHEPEIPVTDGGEIIYWRCRCGKKKWTPPTEEKSDDGKEDTDAAVPAGSE